MVQPWDFVRLAGEGLNVSLPGGRRSAQIALISLDERTNRLRPRSVHLGAHPPQDYDRRVRGLRVGIALLVAICSGFAGCGGDDGGESATQASGPLTLQQRVLTESDVPGSKSDPVETRLKASSVAQLKGWPDYWSAESDDADKLAKAGFVSAIHDTRFIPDKPGGPHTREARHVRLLVTQFDSAGGADTGADLLYKNGLKPCPGECAMQIEKFDVSGLPDARGVHRFISDEAAAESGEMSFDSYTVWFADGPFAYELEMFAPWGRISKDQLEDIAQRLHDRVEGAPPAGT
jgi:hypothetical protein